MAEIHGVVNGQNAGKDVPIEIRELAASIKQELDSVTKSQVGKLCCIYRVHAKFHRMNEYAYTPQMVSIGPFHHGKEALRGMEDHKLRYMRVLLSRTTGLDTTLEECLASISRIEEEARKCYAEPIDLDSKRFVKMMVVDGLFIIELFGRSAGLWTVDRDDTIFSNKSNMSSLVRDMILLENQLPMQVLKNLFEIVKGNSSVPFLQGRSLSDLALHFFDSLMKREEAVLENYFRSHGKHLLELLRKTFQPDEERKRNKNQKHSATEPGKQELVHIPSVTELRQAGVKFKKGSTTGSFVDVKFIDGVLIIPPILVQDQTDALLRNLIASEQYRAKGSISMTSYAFLMDSLINSPADVGILRHFEIITNYLGDDKAVSSLFNTLCSEVTLEKFYYSELCNEVNRYYRTRWHIWRATLKRDYFNNPWATISFIGAILLLILTAIATVFAVLAYYSPKGK